MLKIDAEKIISDIIRDRFGLEPYEYIMSTLKLVDVSTDREFQKKFNWFYMIRRNSQWRQIYYNYFEKNKYKSDISFQEVIEYMYKNTGLIEPSFSSKLIATINPANPIWDQYIVKNLNLNAGKIDDTKEKRMNDIVKSYNTIKKMYSDFLGTENGKMLIAVFDMYLPKYKHISEVKKLDCFVWQNR